TPSDGHPRRPARSDELPGLVDTERWSPTAASAVGRAAGARRHRAMVTHGRERRGARDPRACDGPDTCRAPRRQNGRVLIRAPRPEELPGLVDVERAAG